MKLVELLKALIFYKLYIILYEYTLYEAYYNNIIKLIKYIYENTPRHKRIDSLRKLIIYYMPFEQI